MKYILRIVIVVLSCSTFFVYGQTTVTFSPSSDTYVASQWPTNTYDTGTAMYTYYYGNTYRMYLDFDVSSIPSNAIITEATLKMYCPWVNNGANHPYYLQRATSGWGGSKSWNNQPTTTTSDQISITHAATSSTGWHNFDVKDHAQYMVNYPDLNFGWGMKLQSESGTTRGNKYWTNEYGTTSLRPELEIKYVLPIDIVGYTTHCTNGNSDGSISINVTEGSGTYDSYEWFKFDAGDTESIESGTNIANADVDNLDPGLYLFHVEDDEGVTGYKYFLVGEEGETTNVSMYANDSDTSSMYWDDAMVYDRSGYKDNNYGSQNSYSPSYSPFTPYETKILNRFEMDFDFLLDFQSAEVDLFLPGSSWHYRGSQYDNEVYIRRITEDWQEDVVTFNTIPSLDTNVVDSIPQTASGYGYTDADIDIISAVEYWQNNPSENHGIVYELADPTASTGNWMRQIYGSSDYTSSVSDRPKFELSFEVKETLITDFTDSTLIGEITINAPNGELPFTYLISRDSIPIMDTIWTAVKDTVDIDSADFYQGKINSQNYTFSNLSGGRYFIGVFDNNGDQIYMRDTYIAPSLRLTDSTDIIISGDTIKVDTANASSARTTYFYPIPENEDSGFEIKIAVLDDFTVGFNDLLSAPAAYMEDMEFAIQVDGNGDVDFLTSGTVRSSTTCSVGDHLALQKQGQEILFLKNSEVLSRIEITSFPRGGYRTDLLLIEAFAELVYWPYIPSFNGTHKSVQQPKCGGAKGELSIAEFGYFYWGTPTSYQLHDEDYNLESSGSTFPVTISDLDPGVYYLSTWWSSGLVTSYERVVIGYPLTWSSFSNAEVLNGTVNTLDQINNPPEGYASSVNTVDPTDPLTDEFFVVSEFTIDPGFWLYTEGKFKFTDGTTDFLTIEIFTLYGVKYFSFYTDGTQIDLVTSPAIPNSYLNSFDPAHMVSINNNKPFKIEYDGSNMKVTHFDYSNFSSVLLIDEPVTLGSDDIYVYGEVVNHHIKNSHASFCSPIASNSVKLRRTIDGGYYIAVNGLLKVEYDEEYNDNKLEFNVYEDSYDPQDPIESQIDMTMLPISYGDNRLEFNFDCPGSDCLTSGIYILEVINDKDEKLYLRFKI